MEGKQQRVLIVFATPFLYGMERGVIEIFDLLRPEIQPLFLIFRHTKLQETEQWLEIKGRELPCVFFHEGHWPRFGMPRSIKQFFQMILAALILNYDTLRASVNCNVLYLPGDSYLYFSFITAIFYKIKRRKIICHFHNLLQTPSKSLKLTSLFVTDYIHNTELGYQLVVEANPFIKKKRNHIIAYPIRENSLVKDQELNGRLAGKRNILFIGQVAAHKGVDILLKAFKLVSSHYKDAALHIIGGGEQKYLESLSEYVSGIEDKVKFWGYRNDISYFLSEAYIHVIPSPPSRCHESFGIVTAEAMAYGVPTVCFKSGASQELVVNEQTGLVCEEESHESFAEGVQRFLNDPSFRNVCGKLARKRFEENYSRAKIRDLWLKLFEG